MGVPWARDERQECLIELNEMKVALRIALYHFSDIPAALNLGTGTTTMCVSEREKFPIEKEKYSWRKLFFLFLFPSGYINEWCRWWEKANKLLFKIIKRVRYYQSDMSDSFASTLCLIFQLFNSIIELSRFDTTNSWIEREFSLYTTKIDDVNVMAIQ